VQWNFRNFSPDVSWLKWVTESVITHHAKDRTNHQSCLKFRRNVTIPRQMANSVTRGKLSPTNYKWRLNPVWLYGNSGRQRLNQRNQSINQSINQSYPNWNTGADVCWPNWKLGTDENTVAAAGACSQQHITLLPQHAAVGRYQAAVGWMNEWMNESLHNSSCWIIYITTHRNFILVQFEDEMETYCSSMLWQLLERTSI